MTRGEHAWHQFPCTFCIQNPMSKTTRLSVFMASLSVYILSSESGPQNHDMDCRAGGAPLSSKPYLNKTQALGGWTMFWVLAFTLESDAKLNLESDTIRARMHGCFYIGIRSQNAH